jgi:hypothetical protein
MSKSEVRAQRLLGALFLGGFGTAWLLLWAFRQFNGHPIPVVAAGVVGVALLAWVYLRYRFYSKEIIARPETPDEKRLARMFHIVNAGQWVVILVLSNVLNNMGLSMWIIPMVMAVIGAHFLPLAHLFKTPSRYVTGAGMLAVAMLYPLVAPRGPEDPVGCLCAAAVLWGSALWSVRHDG